MELLSTNSYGDRLETLKYYWDNHKILHILKLMYLETENNFNVDWYNKNSKHYHDKQ